MADTGLMAELRRAGELLERWSLLAPLIEEAVQCLKDTGLSAEWRLACKIEDALRGEGESGG